MVQWEVLHSFDSKNDMGTSELRFILGPAEQATLTMKNNNKYGTPNFCLLFRNNLSWKVMFPYLL